MELGWHTAPTRHIRRYSTKNLTKIGRIAEIMCSAPNKMDRPNPKLAIKRRKKMKKSIAHLPDFCTFNLRNLAKKQQEHIESSGDTSRRNHKWNTRKMREAKSIFLPTHATTREINETRLIHRNRKSRQRIHRNRKDKVLTGGTDSDRERVMVG